MRSMSGRNLGNSLEGNKSSRFFRNSSRSLDHRHSHRSSNNSHSHAALSQKRQSVGSYSHASSGMAQSRGSNASNYHRRDSNGSNLILLPGISYMDSGQGSVNLVHRSSQNSHMSADTQQHRNVMYSTGNNNRDIQRMSDLSHLTTSSMLLQHQQQLQESGSNLQQNLQLPIPAQVQTSRYISQSQRTDSGLLREATELFLPLNDHDMEGNQYQNKSNNHNQYHNMKVNQNAGVAAYSQSPQSKNDNMGFREEFRRQMILSRQHTTESGKQSIRDLATLSARKVGANINFTSMRSVRSDVTWDDPVENLDDAQIDLLVQSLEERHNANNEVDNLSTSLASTSLNERLEGNSQNYYHSRNGEVPSRGIMRKHSSSELSIPIHSNRSAKHRRNYSDDSNVYKAMMRKNHQLSQQLLSGNHQSRSGGGTMHVRSASDTSLPMYAVSTANPGMFDPIPVNDSSSGQGLRTLHNKQQQQSFEESWSPDQQTLNRSNYHSYPLNLENPNRGTGSGSDNNVRFSGTSSRGVVSYDKMGSFLSNTSGLTFGTGKAANFDRLGSGLSNISGFSCGDRLSWMSTNARVPSWSERQSSLSTSTSVLPQPGLIQSGQISRGIPEEPITSSSNYDSFGANVEEKKL